jgi:hypothetical protein
VQALVIKQICQYESFRSRGHRRKRFDEKIYTIGVAGKGAEEFFAKLEKGGVQRVVEKGLKKQLPVSGFCKER